MSEIDLLVIGAGACGLAAAIAAHDAGIDVAIVEKRDRPGGNSSLSTGSIPVSARCRDRGFAPADDRGFAGGRRSS
jgi:fumarate reductase flavoprotein subunit